MNDDSLEEYTLTIFGMNVVNESSFDKCYIYVSNGFHIPRSHMRIWISQFSLNRHNWIGLLDNNIYNLKHAIWTFKPFHPQTTFTLKMSSSSSILSLCIQRVYHENIYGFTFCNPKTNKLSNRRPFLGFWHCKGPQGKTPLGWGREENSSIGFVWILRVDSP